MSSGVYPISTQIRNALTRPSLAVRIRTRMNRAWLDQAIAEGADPTSSPELALRAAQLTSHAGRLRLAEGVARLLDGATESGDSRNTPRRSQAEIWNSAEDLLRVALRLQAQWQPITPRGAAKTAELLRAVAGPDGGSRVNLRAAARSTRRLVDPPAVVEHELAKAA
jgi:hypothetical protein